MKLMSSYEGIWTCKDCHQIIDMTESPEHVQIATAHRWPCEWDQALWSDFYCKRCLHKYRLEGVLGNSHGTVLRLKEWSLDEVWQCEVCDICGTKLPLIDSFRVVIHAYPLSPVYEYLCACVNCFESKRLKYLSLPRRIRNSARTHQI